MYEEFAELITQRAYPNFTNPEERALIVQTLTEELTVGFRRAFDESLTEQQRAVMYHYARTKDPRLDGLLDELGWDEKWAEFSRAFANEHLNIDASDSLIPEKSVQVLSTVRIRSDDELAAAKEPKAPAPWPARPASKVPGTTPEGPTIKLNLGRRKA